MLCRTWSFEMLPSVSTSCVRALIAAVAADVVDMIIIMVVAGTIPFANIIPCHVIKIWHPKSAHYAHFPHLFLGKSFMKCQKVCMQNISTLLGLTEGRVGSTPHTKTNIYTVFTICNFFSSF